MWNGEGTAVAEDNGGDGGSGYGLGDAVDVGEELFSSSLDGELSSGSGEVDEAKDVFGVAVEAAAAAAAAEAAAIVCSLKKRDICLLRVEFLGPLSC